MLCCVETLQRFSGCWRLESLCSEVSDYSETVQGHCSSWTEHRLSAAPHTLSCQNTSECVGNLRISLRCKVTQTFKDSVEWDALVSDAGFAETRSKWFCVFELIWDNTLTETGLGSGSGVHHFHRTIGIYWCQNMTPGEDPFSLDVWVYSECPHPLPHGSFLISHSGADRILCWACQTVIHAAPRWESETNTAIPSAPSVPSVPGVQLQAAAAPITFSASNTLVHTCICHMWTQS